MFQIVYFPSLSEQCLIFFFGIIEIIDLCSEHQVITKMNTIINYFLSALRSLGVKEPLSIFKSQAPRMN